MAVYTIAADFGSGESTCAAATSQLTCPPQCCWCVEASKCASTWEACELPPSSSSAFGSLLLLAAILLIVCAFAAPAMKNRDGAAVSAGGIAAEESYELQIESIFEQGMGSSPSAAAPVLVAGGGMGTRQPEGERLLSSA